MVSGWQLFVYSQQHKRKLTFKKGFSTARKVFKLPRKRTERERKRDLVRKLTSTNYFLNY